MRIETNYTTTGAAELAKTAKQTIKPAAGSKSSEVSQTDFEESSKLEQALTATPDTRSEAVEKAKALAADPNFPSDEQLGKLAGLLAKHLA
jgi:hypothetical protein